jgi:hypothetical protein
MNLKQILNENKSGETSYTGKFKKSGESREFILHSKDRIVKESVNEGKLQFKNLKKGDILVGKFPPYKEMEVISSTDKSAKVKSSKGGVVDMYSTNNYELKETSMKLSKLLKENTEPQIITQLRDVMKSGYKKLRCPKTKKVMTVDSYSASAIVKVYDALKDPKNKEKFSSMGLMGMQSMAFKLLK